MSRHVLPQAAQLFSRGLTDASPEMIRKVLAQLGQYQPKPPAFGQHGLPVALRWCSLPSLGFPRQPFQVFRRGGRIALKQIASAVQISGTGTVEWGRVNMFHVFFRATPDAGSSLTIQALDRVGRRIPGQTVSVASASQCRFRAPGVAALSVTGNGLISAIQGITANDFANLNDWDLIEIVGLPFKRGEIASPHYDPHPQGFDPANKEGVEAARIRLELAAMLHQPLPLTGIATIPTPNWPPPNIDSYLSFVRDPADSVLPMISKCLLSTNDADPNNLQAAFLYTQTGPGIRQADFPGVAPGPDPTQFDIPVVGVTMLSVGSESYAAAALGYGTIDFPPASESPLPKAVEPALSFHTDFDYMVTNTFILADGIKVELAALAQGRPDPEAAAFSVDRLRRNRPPAVDQPETESVQLTWNHAMLPQGYVVARSRKADTSELLNSPRPFPQGFELFTPPRGENAGSAPPEEPVVFTDPVSEVPVSGLHDTEYLLAGGDVFGRWSAWTHSTYVSVAPPVQIPGLHSVTTSLDPDTATGRKVTGDLIVEFAWDWTDRSARFIEFHGRFYSGSAGPPVFSPGLQIDSDLPVEGAAVVSFDAARNPSVTSGHDADVEILTPVPDDENRRYRLTVHQFRADFRLQSQWDYAAFARAEESIRPAGEFSETAGPRTTKIFDPLPPEVPEITADLQWTALPDAANRARGVLTWPADPQAMGYVVWEATEAAIRYAIDPDIPEPAPEATPMDRALALATLLADEDNRQRSAIAFSRLNADPLLESQIEVELPGGASTLFAYRVSSLSAANQESGRSSSVAWFAVPRRIKPGQPGLRVRAVPDGLEVTAIAAPGPAPIGYNVFRVRNSALLADTGLKGPPKIPANHPDWQDLTINNSAAMQIVDNVGESWQPYYYQAVAIAQANPANGEFAGESAPSATIAAFRKPSEPPAFILLSSQSNADNRLIVFRSNIPAKPTQLGTSTIEVLEYVRDPADGPLLRRTLLTIDSMRVPVAVAPTVPAAGSQPLTLTREPNTPDGFTVFHLQFPLTVTSPVLVLRDPLLRVTERSLKDA